VTTSDDLSLKHILAWLRTLDVVQNLYRM